MMQFHRCRVKHISMQVKKISLPYVSLRQLQTKDDLTGCMFKSSLYNHCHSEQLKTKKSNIN